MDPIDETPFKLDKQNVQKFSNVPDPFNPPNVISGYIQLTPNFHYGSLYITEVNGRQAYQTVVAAPKQHYPFDSKNRWDFPGYYKIETYEKYDGTCIIGFAYHDENWNDTYVSYKTRRTVFLSNEGKFGNLVNLWNEIRGRYKVDDLIKAFSTYSWVFELYGTRRHHLIRYDTPLDIKLLFAREHMSPYRVFPPTPNFAISHYAETFGIPMARPISSISEQDKEKLREIYLEQVKWLESQIIEVSMDLPSGDDNPTSIGILGGMEGTVWYFMMPGGAVQMKCKPRQVLDYHWGGASKGPHIPISSIYMTVANAFEESATPTVELVNELLREEFPAELVERCQGTTQRLIDEAIFRRGMAEKLLAIYKESGLDWSTSRGSVMKVVNQKLLSEYPDRRRKYLAKLCFSILSGELGR